MLMYYVYVPVYCMAEVIFVLYSVYIIVYTLLYMFLYILGTTYPIWGTTWPILWGLGFLGLRLQGTWFLRAEVSGDLVWGA